MQRSEKNLISKPKNLFSTNSTYLSSIKMGLSKTKSEDKDLFLKQYVPKFSNLVRSYFQPEDQITAFRMIMAKKRVEKSDFFPKPRAESWESILFEASQCLFHLKKNLTFEIFYKLQVIYSFEQFSYSNSKFLQLALPSNSDSYNLRVFEELPWVLRFYDGNNPIQISKTHIPKNCQNSFECINRYLRLKKPFPHEFGISLTYRLS